MPENPPATTAAQAVFPATQWSLVLRAVRGTSSDTAPALETLCRNYWPPLYAYARRDVLPFLASIALFLLGYLGLVISTYPYLVPPVLTFWDAAAAPASQIFLLLGTIFLLPIILGYYVFIYWLFQGKVREGEGYH